MQGIPRSPDTQSRNRGNQTRPKSEHYTCIDVTPHLPPLVPYQPVHVVSPSRKKPASPISNAHGHHQRSPKTNDSSCERLLKSHPSKEFSQERSEKETAVFKSIGSLSQQSPENALLLLENVLASADIGDADNDLDQLETNVNDDRNDNNVIQRKLAIEQLIVSDSKAARNSSQVKGISQRPTHSFLLCRNGNTPLQSVDHQQEFQQQTSFGDSTCISNQKSASMRNGRSETSRRVSLARARFSKSHQQSIGKVGCPDPELIGEVPVAISTSNHQVDADETPRHNQVSESGGTLRQMSEAERAPPGQELEVMARMHQRRAVLNAQGSIESTDSGRSVHLLDHEGHLPTYGSSTDSPREGVCGENGAETRFDSEDVSYGLDEKDSQWCGSESFQHDLQKRQVTCVSETSSSRVEESFHRNARQCTPQGARRDLGSVLMCAAQFEGKFVPESDEGPHGTAWSHISDGRTDDHHSFSKISNDAQGMVQPTLTQHSPFIESYNRVESPPPGVLPGALESIEKV